MDPDPVWKCSQKTTQTGTIRNATNIAQQARLTSLKPGRGPSIRSGQWIEIFKPRPKSAIGFPSSIQFPQSVHRAKRELGRARHTGRRRVACEAFLRENRGAEITFPADRGSSLHSPRESQLPGAVY